MEAHNDRGYYILTNIKYCSSKDIENSKDIDEENNEQLAVMSHAEAVTKLDELMFWAAGGDNTGWASNVEKNAWLCSSQVVLQTDAAEAYELLFQ